PAPPARRGTARPGKAENGGKTVGAEEERERRATADQPPFVLRWDWQTNPLPRRPVQGPPRRGAGVPGTEAPPWPPTGADAAPALPGWAPVRRGRARARAVRGHRRPVYGPGTYRRGPVALRRDPGAHRPHPRPAGAGNASPLP